MLRQGIFEGNSLQQWVDRTRLHLLKVANRKMSLLDQADIVRNLCVSTPKPMAGKTLRKASNDRCKCEFWIRAPTISLLDFVV